MATNTSYLGLTKPAQSDLYNVDVFNDNADKVDTNAQKTAANLATIEAVATASKPYVVGEYLVLNGILYKVTQAIANGGALVVGTNIAQDNVGTELKSIKDALSSSIIVERKSMPAFSIASGTVGTYGASVSLNVAKTGYKIVGVSIWEMGHGAQYFVVPSVKPSSGYAYCTIYRAQTSAISQNEGDIKLNIVYAKE